MDAFAHVKILTSESSGYKLIVIGTISGSISSSCGVAILPDQTILESCTELDTLIISGGKGISEIFNEPPFGEFLEKQYNHSRRFAAIGNGVFAFGPMGFLDGRQVTTHWMDAARLCEFFPHAIVRPAKIYVKDYNLYTSAGFIASIELSLLMIEEDFGKKLAFEVAKYLVVYLRRAGDQSQYSPLLEVQGRTDSQVEIIQSYLMSNMELNHSLDSLAKRVHMSPRNLSRLFTKEIGSPPMQFLSDARIDAARRYLETTELSIKDISHRCGFESADKLRRVFSKKLKISPGAYRTNFIL